MVRACSFGGIQVKRGRSRPRYDGVVGSRLVGPIVGTSIEGPGGPTHP